ncbi:MAG: protein kinase [Pseudonocardia sp.]
MEPEMFGPYRLDRLIGRGGMGAVYHAHDTQSQRMVALKLLPGHLGHDEAFVLRFKREAQLAASLSDPHVIPIHRFGEIDGVPYIDMRFVAGRDLKAILHDEGTMPAARAVNIIGQVAQALDAAHVSGLVHRDVKPSNILVAGGGGEDFAYLTDFGVARVAGGDVEVTGPGVAVGTLTYMAPEQFEGGLDGRSDVYALGCVLYEMLAGRPPFTGESAPELMFAHLKSPPPRPSDYAAVPLLFDDVVARALAKEPESRYPTAGALAHAARAAISSGGPVSSPTADPPGTAGHQDTPTVVINSPAPPHVREWPLVSPSGATAFVPSRARVDGFPTVQAMRLPLHPAFRFVTGPLRPGGPIPLIDNQPAVDGLRDRIRYSPGGAVLVTGFTGVGKTTVVDRALHELHTALAGADEPVPLVVVWMNVARPMSPDALLVTLIRRLHDVLHRAGVLERVEPVARDVLLRAYRRTSAAHKQVLMENREDGGELAFPLGGAGAAGKVNRRRTSGRQEELVERDYTFEDMEHDLRSVLEDLSTEVSTPSAGVLARLFRRAPPRWSGRLVVVLDELDKLTGADGGRQSLERMLAALKNVFAASRVHFVFVGGADVLDEARSARGRGSSIYDGVFGSMPYIRCLSADAPRRMLSAVLVAETAPAQLDGLCDYLEYRSRGRPRDLLEAMQRLVVWAADGPSLAVDDREAAAVSFFGGLHKRIDVLLAEPGPVGPLDHDIDRDRRRFGLYLLADWALRRGNGTFTADDLLADAAGRPDPCVLPDELVRELLDKLARPDVAVLERVTIEGAAQTVVDYPQAEDAVFRLASDVLAAARGSGQAVATIAQVGGGRYRLLQELGRGALGRTYRAYDEHGRRTVAIKLLDLPAAAGDELARQRFLREAELAQRLTHCGLAATYGSFEEPNGLLGLVSELVVGQSLEDLLAQRPMPASEAVGMARELVDLLIYLRAEGVVRLDLKPSNIVLRAGAGALLTDLGIARRLAEPQSERITAAGAILGTPRYAAPEQLRGEEVDGRAAEYSLGLVLYEALTGVPARPDASSSSAIMAAVSGERVDVEGLDCSPQLRGILEKLLRFDRNERFETPEAIAAALHATPEAATRSAS